MSEIIQFPGAQQRQWKEIEAGMISGLSESGFSPEEICRIATMMQPACGRVFACIQNGEVALPVLQIAIYEELLLLAIQIERGRA